MKLKFTSTIGAVVAALALTVTANAVPITGGISLAGGYVTDTGNLNTADAFTSFSNVRSTGANGSFAPIGVNTLVNQNGFVFDPFPGAGVNPLWNVTVGANTYSFNLGSPVLVTQPGDNTLEIKGTGIFSITGPGNFTPTAGAWIFTANQLGGTFSFSSSNGVNVPDGGTTAVLLGLSLLGVHGARRKFAKV